MAPGDHRIHIQESHTPEAIRQRMGGGQPHEFLRDMVYGAVDGTVTTFAIIAGVQGANLAPGVAIALGFANLLADGFSMAAANYISLRSERQKLEKFRRIEEYHVETVPHGEMEEVRQIYAAKGFASPLLDDIVRIITEDRKRWVDTMLVEEHGLSLSPTDPLKAGMATFGAFAVAGMVPLVPFLVMTNSQGGRAFEVASIATAFTFMGIGWVKARVLHMNRWMSALETLAIGGSAALIAYGVGMLFR